ncbi:hypothetical protein D3C72_1391860 [compost metagenome]
MSFVISQQRSFDRRTAHWRIDIVTAAQFIEIVISQDVRFFCIDDYAIRKALHQHAHEAFDILVFMIDADHDEFRLIACDIKNGFSQLMGRAHRPFALCHVVFRRQ